MTPSRPAQTRQAWPDYAAVWRWHFYAGLFCLPFVCWLAITGSIYLFRPDIEALLDRPYETLHLDGPRAQPSAEVAAALGALPGSTFSRYEPPATVTGAAQIVVARNHALFRVYIHPTTLLVMSLERDDHRLMELMAQLHGNLLLGPRGSTLVEAAASWAIVMILTGLYLWLPRGRPGLGGLLYPRIGQNGRLFWRDLHAVAGFWVSVVTMFILVSGLPWSSNWGHYMTWARNLSPVTAGQPDWPFGGQDPAMPVPPASSMPGMTAPEMAAMSPAGAPGHVDLLGLDTAVATAVALDLPRPVWVQPPMSRGGDWKVGSQTQNRPLRVDYAVDPATGKATLIRDFARENVVDRVVNFAIATHEGQLFGRLNQAILLANAACLLLMSISAVMMWWRRRPAHALGAPDRAARPRFSAALAMTVVVLSVLIPLFGVSLVVVLTLDRALLPRLPAARRWLGLAPHPV